MAGFLEISGIFGLDKTALQSIGKKFVPSDARLAYENIADTTHRLGFPGLPYERIRQRRLSRCSNLAAKAAKNRGRAAPANFIDEWQPLSRLGDNGDLLQSRDRRYSRPLSSSAEGLAEEI